MSCVPPGLYYSYGVQTFAGRLQKLHFYGRLIRVWPLAAALPSHVSDGRWLQAGRSVWAAPLLHALHIRAPASISTAGRGGMHCWGYFWLSLSHTCTHTHTGLCIFAHTHTCLRLFLGEAGILAVAASSCSTLHLS